MQPPPCFPLVPKTDGHHLDFVGRHYDCCGQVFVCKPRDDDHRTFRACLGETLEMEIK